jgi:hypothetical protein
MISPVRQVPATSRSPASVSASAVISAVSFRTGPASGQRPPVTGLSAICGALQSSSTAALSGRPGRAATGWNMSRPATARSWNSAVSRAPGNRQAIPMIATDSPRCPRPSIALRHPNGFPVGIGAPRRPVKGNDETRGYPRRHAFPHVITPFVPPAQPRLPSRPPCRTRLRPRHQRPARVGTLGRAACTCEGYGGCAARALSCAHACRPAASYLAALTYRRWRGCPSSRGAFSLQVTITRRGRTESMVRKR